MFESVGEWSKVLVAVPDDWCDPCQHWTRNSLGSSNPGLSSSFHIFIGILYFFSLFLWVACISLHSHFACMCIYSIFNCKSSNKDYNWFIVTVTNVTFDD